MENLLKIAAAYIRVSSERQDEYSPDSQLKKTREYAEKEGYIIPDEYVFYDDGISGKSVKKRDEFNRMIAMAKEKDHPFEVIYVWKFSRFARNQEEAMVYKNLLRKKGVSVVSVSEPIPEGHFGTLIERIIEWMDEFYLINLGAEVQRGLQEKFSRGEPTGPAPFGYLSEKKTFIPDEESGAADIIREIFQRFADGEPAMSISRSLVARGVTTKQGRAVDKRWVTYIVNNPVYIGKLRSSNGTGALNKHHYTDENIKVTDGHHQPIISLDIWDKVQAILDEKRKTAVPYARPEQPTEHMLKGIVRCSSCGSSLTVTSISARRKSRSYQCCKYARGACTVSHAITLPKLEAAVISALEQVLQNEQFTISPQKKKPTSNQPDFDKLIAVEERKLERAKQAFLAEIDSIEQYGKNKKDITKRIDELKTMRDKNQEGKIDINLYKERTLEIIQFLKDENVSPGAKNKALRSIIEKIVYDKPNNSLSIYFFDL